MSFAIEPGELVAIVGGSGAGKTTLLEAVASIRSPDEGMVSFNGMDAASDLGEVRRTMGYVPQDDIIHAELPLRSTLRYAAQLRMPTETTATTVDELVADVLDQLDLRDQA